MFERTRWRLVGWNVLVLTVILVLVGGAVYLTARQLLTSEVDRDLLARSREFPREFRGADRGLPKIGPSGYSGGYFFLLLDSDGQILDNQQDVSLSQEITDLETAEFRTVNVNGELARLRLVPLRIPNGDSLTMVVGQSLVPVERALRRLLIGLLAGGGAGVVLSFIGAWFLAGRALVPIEFAFRRQQEFIADASHELRTPLTVLRASADLLNRHRDEPLDANRQLFDDFRHELLRLERLATDLLMLARTDVGDIDLAVAPIDLVLIASDVVRRTAPLALARRVSLRADESSEPLVVEADPDRIQQVILILLDNALKHTPTGGNVTIHTEKHGNEAVLSVQDTGEGIADEHLPRLFDRFYRIDRARSRLHGSAGLGLPIAKSLIEAHDGQLAIVSEHGSGTTATIRLSLFRAAPNFGSKIGRLTAPGRQAAEHP